MRRDLMQDSSTSPILLSIFINNSTAGLRKVKRGMKVGLQEVSALLYVGDIVVVATSRRELQELINECERYSEVNTHLLSPSKCCAIPPTKFTMRNRISWTDLNPEIYGSTAVEF